MAEGAGDRHAVAAVEHVVAVGPLEDDDRGQPAPAAVGARDALPPGRDAVGGGSEAGVEVRRGIDGADDRAEPDRPHPRRVPGQRLDAAEVARTRPARAASPQRSADAGGEVAAARALEVRARAEH
jgi:hypothetical protein